MPASELRRKTTFFLIFAGSISLILILFPFIEDGLWAYVEAQFGLIVAENGAVRTVTGEAPRQMIETTIGLVVNVLNIINIILWMALVIATVRYVGWLILKTAHRGARQGEVSTLIQTVLSIIIYIVAFFIIFQSQYPSVQLAPLFTGSAIIGIVVGLALQDTLGNLFSGLALQADQPFQVGDVIGISNGGTGVVEGVSWRGVKIRTFQNKLLVISNTMLGKESIEVAPKGNLNARLVFFSTIYSASPARTAHIVREAIRLGENVSQKIRPIVRIKALGESGVDWEIKYWLDDYSKYNDSDAMVRERVWYALHREKIAFSFPTRTVHIEEKVEEAAPEEIVNTYAEHLNRVSIFAPLSEEEIEQLANASAARTYAPGEPIVRRGQQGNSMFVIISGGVKVQIPEKTYQKTINNLKENDFFGEMSLLTGEPRTATVIATEETEVLRIDKEGLKPIFENNPPLVQSIVEQIEERRALLQAQAQADSLDPEDEKRKGVMKSIKSFFGLR